MALSTTAQKIIRSELDAGGKAGKNSVVYTVETGLLDKARDGVVATMSFRFTKPVSQDLLDVRSSKILALIANSLDMQGDLPALENMLQRVAGNKSTIGRKRSTGKVSVQFGDPEDTNGFDGSLQGASGRQVSNSNMKQLLEILAKQYLIKEMKRAGAPLKYRTGRFANSLKITRATLLDKAPTSVRKPPELEVAYNYRLRPYSVFNPAVSTYRRLSLRPFAGARNPQKLIGEAIAKATRDLLHSRYRITVKQGT